jgi:hypothetical protein
MEPVVLKPGQIVDNPEAAALLVNPRALHFLGPFMRRPQTLSMVAKELGTSPSAVAYWVPKFVRARLIRRVSPPRNEPSSRGKWYRSVATSFLVPTNLLPAEQNGSSIESGRRHYMERFYAALARASPGDTRWISVSILERQVRLRASMLDPRMPSLRRGRTLDAWLDFELTKAEAKELKEEMLLLINKYRERDRVVPKAARYLVHVGVTPAEDE